jgi:hypothetical protein
MPELQVGGGEVVDVVALVAEGGLGSERVSSGLPVVIDQQGE